MRRPQIWYRWLEAVGVVVFGYALALVFAAFDFGPAEAIDTARVRDYLRLPFMVLGAVMAGWTLTLNQIVKGATARRIEVGAARHRHFPRVRPSSSPPPAPR